MRELRDHAGVSVLIYDQTCATEAPAPQARRLSRPARRVLINERVGQGADHPTDPIQRRGGHDRRQPVDGPISVPMISRQVAAEGIDKIVVVTDEPEYRGMAGMAPACRCITATNSTR